MNEHTLAHTDQERARAACLPELRDDRDMRAAVPALLGEGHPDGGVERN